MAGPTTPPTGSRFSTGTDAAALSGPSSAPGGAVTVTAGGTALDSATSANPAGTTFYLLAGTHVLGGSSPNAFNQVIPKAGNTYVGAPGAILDGRGINRYAFTGQAANVTIKTLEVKGFVAPLEEFVVNHDAGAGWTITGCNIHDNAGAAVGIGSNTTLTQCWLHDNTQYGFSSYRPPVDAGATPSITTVLVDRCEISYNGTLSDEYKPDGTPTYNGRNGAGKFWDTDGITIINSWVHHSRHVAIWADTNNKRTRIEGNLIEDNNGEGFFYEISYNFLVKDNTFRRNAIQKGLNFASRSDNFPVAAIYLSEAGGDSAVATLYANSEVTGNTFTDNWGDLTLWENADRFCNSPSNTSSKVYKPLGSVASLAVCNEPTTKTITISTTAGSTDFTVTVGSLVSTDEGRGVSGSGIPTGAKIAEPTGPSGPRGVITSTQGRLSAAATATSTQAVTLAAGTINAAPGYDACRWHTKNVEVHHNTFSHDRNVVLGSTAVPSNVRTGKIALLSQFGTYPSWSPYKGTTIQQAITFDQNNRWHDNTYTGPYTFMPYDTGRNLSLTQWQASPYLQDSGSTLGAGNPDPPAQDPPTPQPTVSAQVVTVWAVPLRSV